MLTLQEFLDEKVLNFAAREKRKKSLKKSAPKRKAAMKRNKKKHASADKLRARAAQKAIKTIKQKMVGDTPLKDLSISQRVHLDKRMEKKGSAIKKLTKKLLKVVKQQERERLQKVHGIDEMLTFGEYYNDF